MARRKELRYLTVGLMDGFTGTGAINESSPSAGESTVGVDTLSLTDSLKIVPKGARFTTAGNTTMRTVTATQNSQVWTVTIDATGGTFTLTLNGEETSGISYDATSGAVQTALETLASVTVGDVTVTGDGPHVITLAGNLANTSGNTLTSDPALLTGGAGTAAVVEDQDGTETWEITFSPAWVAGSVPSDDDVIQFYPQTVELKIGEGNVEYSETQEAIVDTDRGLLDGMRAGTDQPLTWSASFVYNWMRASSGDPITVYEALKQKGDASTWVNSSVDKCEPYQFDFYMIDTPPCGSEEVEITIFRYSRVTSINPSVEAASVSLDATSKSTEPEIVRVANDADTIAATLAPAS